MVVQPEDAGPGTQPEGELAGRTFLCVVDETAELHQALRFACGRAKKTGGRVALLYVIEPVEFQHWMAVGHLMAEERREQAEEMLQVVSSVVQKLSGAPPIVYLREGNLTEQLLTLLASEEPISILVLGASTGSEGPGHVLTYILKRLNKIKVPVTIVPGNLSDTEIDAIT